MITFPIDFGPDPSMRKGAINRELAAVVEAAGAAADALIAERYHWEQDVRGLSESAAITEVQELSDRLAEQFREELRDSLNDVYAARAKALGR